MYTVNVSWIGGPEWDLEAPSMFNPNKKKSPTEHLIETGGQSIDEAIESFDKFRDYPIKVEQYKKPGVNWVTALHITEKDDTKALSIVEELVTRYNKKKDQLTADPSGYSIEIEVVNG
jgi:hypothetical protein